VVLKYYKTFFSSDGSGSCDRTFTGLSETSAGAKSALSVELRTSFILRPGVLYLRPLAKAVSFAAVKSLPEELVKRLLLVP
jgi:hypothetical protein